MIKILTWNVKLEVLSVISYQNLKTKATLAMYFSPEEMNNYWWEHSVALQGILFTKSSGDVFSQTSVSTRS